MHRNSLNLLKLNWVGEQQSPDFILSKQELWDQTNTISTSEWKSDDNKHPRPSLSNMESGRSLLEDIPKQSTLDEAVSRHNCSIFQKHLLFLWMARTPISFFCCIPVTSQMYTAILYLNK